LSTTGASAMLTSTPTVLLTTRKRLCEVSFLRGKEDPGML
jgi:hypothetical protein